MNKFHRAHMPPYVRSMSVRTTVTGGTSVLHSIEEVLKRHRIEMGKSDTSNISVREAPRNRGDEAKRVIVQELKQMLDKKVWVPVLGSKLTASQRSAIIRSSMFIKRKNNPDGSVQKLKARLVAGGRPAEQGAVRRSLVTNSINQCSIHNAGCRSTREKTCCSSRHQRSVPKRRHDVRSASAHAPRPHHVCLRDGDRR